MTDDGVVGGVNSGIADDPALKTLGKVPHGALGPIGTVIVVDEFRLNLIRHFRHVTEI